MPLNAADDQFADRLRAVLPDVIRPLTASYLEEPRGRYLGQDGLLVAPRNTDQAAQIVRLCAQARVGIVPYGGGTGLVGGQVLPDGPAPVILSLERMTEIRGVYPTENVIVAEAGVILANLQAAAGTADRLFPLSLASEGSARVGGILATNAGGVNVLRYGNTRDLCLGIEAVLPDGSVLNTLGRLRKDNTGYDLRNLLIGSEGSLGVITAAALKLAPRPVVEGAALLVIDGPQAAVDLLALAGRQLGDGLSAFELISGMGLQFLAETMPHIRQPFAKMPEWMVLVDLGLGAGADAQVALERLFSDAAKAGLVHDGVIAQSGQQRSEFWALREHIPLANRAIGAICSHDISVPISLIPDFIARGGAALAQVAPGCRINCFGHLGDGNLHYNLFPPDGKSKADFATRRGDITTCVHDLVHAFGGSVSAEHGVGRFKVDDLEKYADPAKLAAIRAIKSALDPKGIMNPGVIVRAG